MEVKGIVSVRGVFGCAGIVVCSRSRISALFGAPVIRYGILTPPFVSF